MHGHPLIGDGHIDEHGVIWYNISKYNVTQIEALDYADSLGLRLPTSMEVENAITTGFDLGKDWFWTCERFGAWGFHYNGAFIDDDFSAYPGGNARCVIHEVELHNKRFREKLDILL